MLLLVKRYRVRIPAVNGQQYMCVNATKAFMYQPSIPTTFIMSVYEIERTINKLTTLRRDSQTGGVTGDAPDLNRLIVNWQSILTTYRAHTQSESALFSQETLQLENFVNSYSKWEEGMMSNEDFIAVLDSVDDRIYPSLSPQKNSNEYRYQKPIGTDVKFDDDNFIGHTPVGNMRKELKKGFSDLSATCKHFASSQLNYDTQFVQCQNFNLDASKWAKFSALIDDACSLDQGSPMDASRNPLVDSQMIAQQCIGISSSTGSNSMFDFLKSKNSYLTFGSGSPTTISWTSSVTKSTTFQTNFELAKSSSQNIIQTIEAWLFVPEVDQHSESGGAQGFIINIGKTAEENHEFSRQVTITLDDPNPGKELFHFGWIFSLKLTFFILFR